ncbi:MAG TPA: Rad52/Rad22 family DNA repair protein, partial [Candidatus Krumholzibacterium sp.]|nr:Rad52/Rad22 family DNA repair protein [Candidatus Krumholzibacterium sp.]
MNELFETLFEPFSPSVKQTKTQGGQSITFVSWIHYVVRAWAQFPEGYSKDVRVSEVGGQLIVTVRITDRKSGCYQEALGAAPADKKSWGGAMAEAESQAFRRAMANWGMGLEMYMDDDEWSRVAQSLKDDADSEELEAAEEVLAA